MTTLADLRTNRARLQAKLNARDGQAGYGANAEAIRAAIASLDAEIDAELARIEAERLATEQTEPQTP